MTSRSTRLWLLSLANLAITILAACGGERETGTLGSSEGCDDGQACEEAIDGEPPFDVGAIVRRVHFAFRAEGDALIGGDAAYGVRVASDGSVGVTPYHLRGEARADGAPADVARGAPLRLATATLGRDDAGGAAGAAAPRLEADGSVSIARGAVVEHLRNDDEGLEQSWSFADRPAGHGPLTVRVAVDGERYAGETATGHHFVDDATGVGVRYGVATWVDAAGARTRVATRYEPGALVITVPASLVDGSSYPAVLDPFVSPEFGVDGPIRGSNGRQYFSDAAFDGTNWLVVWEDTRQGTEAIFGTRVNTAGTVLDRGGILVQAVDGVPLFRPRVAFGAGQFFVVWEEARGYVYVCGTRVTTGGTPLDVGSARVRINEGRWNHARPAVAYDGSRYMVAWDDDRAGARDVYVAALNAPTAAMLGEVNLSSTTGPSEIGPDIACRGPDCFVVWDDTLDARGARIDGLTVLGALTVSAAALAEETIARVAFDGTQYNVVWRDTRSGGSPFVYGARYTPAGAPLTPIDVTGFQIADTTGWVGHDIDVACTASRCLAVWTSHNLDNLNVRAAAFGTPAPSTLSLSPPFVVSARGSEEQAATVAWGGGYYLATWTDDRDTGEPNIYGARINEYGTIYDAPDGRLLSDVASGHTQQAPAVAYDGVSYVIVWEDTRPGFDWDILGAAVEEATGSAVYYGGLAIAIAPGDQRAPSIAYNGDHFLVVWQDLRGGSLYETWGAVVESNGYSSWTSTAERISYGAGHQVRPVVARADSNLFDSSFVVVWQDHRNASTTGVDIYGAPVDSTGSSMVSPDGLGIRRAPSNQRDPRVACNATGASCLVTWTHDFSATDPDIHGAIFTGVAEPSSFAISQGYHRELNPAVASNGTDYLVVWSDARLGHAYDVYGRRISGTGVALDSGFPIHSTSAVTDLTRSGRPRVVFDGSAYFVAWQDVVSGLFTLYTRPVSTTGALLGSVETIASGVTAASAELPLDLAAGSAPGRVFFVYERMLSGAARVRGRMRVP